MACSVIFEECTTDALRFSDGRTEQEGRLEVCLRGVWGTVCNNLWSAENTRVACRQLGIGKHHLDSQLESHVGSLEAES